MENKEFLNVINNDLCIACGACSLADNIQINLNKKSGLFEPDANNNIESFDYCPSVKVDYVDLQKKIFGTLPTDEFGVVDKVFLAQSNNINRNNKASSGGLIKEIGKFYYQNNNKSEGIIALAENSGLDYSAKLIKNFKEFDNLPGSIYHQVNFENALKILKNVKTRAGLVAIPCTLEGIYNYIFLKEPELLEKIDLTIGLLCGWTYSHKSIDAMKTYHKLDDPVKKISYRGDGPIGKLKIKSNNKDAEFSRRVNYSYQVAFDRSFNSPRCLLCVNHSNYLSQIVIGDAWLPSTLFTKTGISLVISRTKKTTELIENMSFNNQITSLEVTKDEITASQSKEIVQNISALERIEYLKENNFFVPDFIFDKKIFTTDKYNRKTKKEIKNTIKKRKLIKNERYKYLYLRKIFFELPTFSKRYIQWFLKRIIRIESIKGNRKEIPHKSLKNFK